MEIEFHSDSPWKREQESTDARYTRVMAARNTTFKAWPELSNERKQLLLAAYEDPKISDTQFAKLGECATFEKGPEVVIPRHHFETLSRGSGSCRKGNGRSVVWAERVRDGYLVGPGLWILQGKDGFSRKKDVEWCIEHVTINGELWTVAT
jgi:hypothetical protein